MNFLPFVLALILCGCTAIQKAERANTEKLLAAAGFRVLPANSLKRQESLGSMAP